MSHDRLLSFAPLFLTALLAPPLTSQNEGALPADVQAVVARAGEHGADLGRTWQQLAGERRRCYEFLLAHMPASDYGVVRGTELVENIDLALAARKVAPWGPDLSQALFDNYVLPYAQANEKRESWRMMMVERFGPLVRDCKTPGAAAQKLNELIFDLVNVHYSTKRRRADQSPSESIEQGKASCTGLSILLADACRACCVPARLISVNWPHKRGNHTWVEVWDGAAWRFVGADEPDPAGLDRGWFVGDAAKCAGAGGDAAHRIWAVSFARTENRFAAGWGRVKLWGTDETERYKPVAATQDLAEQGLRTQLDRYFAADQATQASFSFDRNLDEELKSKAGDARLRQLVWQSLRAHDQKRLAADHEAKRVRAGGKESPFTVKKVGKKPAGGWPLVIAMHGGGGVPKKFNDSQWRHMQIYYKDHPEVGGYLYCALRAPTDEWNGFYTDYFYPVLEKLIRQFVVCSDVDPNRVVAIGYSHGGYGAFALGPKMPHRFAAVHASASAPTDGQTVPDGLHSLPFSWMVGGRDTAYGRRDRCVKFAKLLEKLQQDQPGRYPTKFTLIEDCGHGGLPDRDLLQELVPIVRCDMPQHLTWKLTDGTIRDHYWLHVPEPQPGTRIEARLADATCRLSAPAGTELWLDARLHDLHQPLRLVRGDAAKNHTPNPTLRTLCDTMNRRGDPNLAATWILP